MPLLRNLDEGTTVKSHASIEETTVTAPNGREVWSACMTIGQGHEIEIHFSPNEAKAVGQALIALAERGAKA